MHFPNKVGSPHNASTTSSKPVHLRLRWRLGGFLYARDHERSLAHREKVCALILYGTKQGVWFSWMVPRYSSSRSGETWRLLEDGSNGSWIPGSIPFGTPVNVQGRTIKLPVESEKLSKNVAFDTSKSLKLISCLMMFDEMHGSRVCL